MATARPLPGFTPKWGPEAIALAEQARVLSGNKLAQLVRRLQRQTGRPQEKCWQFVIKYGIKAEVDHRRWQEEELDEARELLTKYSVEEVARKLKRSPKALRSALQRRQLSVREIRCDCFSRESLAQILHVRRSEIEDWIERGWLQATVTKQGSRSSYRITPEALGALYKHHLQDLLKRRIPGCSSLLVAGESRGVAQETTDRRRSTDMASIAEANSLFEIDMELDGLLEEIELQIEGDGQPSDDLVARFQEFCEARGEKVDRIGRFVRMMEAREQFCRNEAARLNDRARAAANKIERTKNMTLYYLLSRDLKKIEGQQFTLRAQKNSQDSVRIMDEAALPMCYRRIEARIPGVIWETVLSVLPQELAKTLESFIQEARPDNDAIKSAVAQSEVVPGAELRRGTHLRVA